jgi:hypothetical protein
MRSEAIGSKSEETFPQQDKGGAITNLFGCVEVARQVMTAFSNLVGVWPRWSPVSRRQSLDDSLPRTLSLSRHGL